MARPSNFKGQVVAQGGECRKFALWLKLYDRAVVFLVLKMVGDGNLLNNKTIILLNLAEYPLI